MTVVTLRGEPFDPDFEEFVLMVNDAKKVMAHEISKAILPIFRKYGREAALRALHLIIETMLEGIEQ